MKKIVAAMVLSMALGGFTALAQEKKDMPMKGSMPMKGEGMEGGGMNMSKMNEMHGKMTEMKKGMSGMMKEKGMMKGDDMQAMGKMMSQCSEMMGDMGKMMGGGKMTFGGNGRHVEDDGGHVWDDEADVGAHGTGSEVVVVMNAHHLVPLTRDARGHGHGRRYDRESLIGYSREPEVKQHD